MICTLIRYHVKANKNHYTDKSTRYDKLSRISVVFPFWYVDVYMFVCVCVCVVLYLTERER